MQGDAMDKADQAPATAAASTETDLRRFALDKAVAINNQHGGLAKDVVAEAELILAFLKGQPAPVPQSVQPRPVAA